MEGAPLIFTPELIAAARARAEATRPLIHRWALFEGARRELARAQLERAARLVPPEKRARALGPLHSHEDKQVFAAAGVLLLATVLTDQGWQVEHEPEIEGLTPDLRITKNAARFFVEARHVAGDFGLPAGYQKLQASLRGINTRTPACFSVIEVDGGASLKGFRAFLRRVLDEQRQGPLEYRADGVLIRFELHHPPLESDIAVCFAYSPEEAFWFDDRPAVRAALDEKLKKYSFPLVVALQGIHTGDLFEAAEEELLGGEVIQIPIGHATGGPAGPPRMARARDSLLHRPGSDGDRVRERLEALLPFEVIVTERGFVVRARLLANPAKPHLSSLEEFRPIPSLLHAGPREMAYCDGDGEPTPPAELNDHFVA
jgi:hypothetical protein